MRYYFAAAYARQFELGCYIDELVAAGIGATVVSTWVTNQQEGLDAGFSTAGLTTPAEIELAWKYGQRDIEDLARADAIVSFTGEGVRGGRHVEHGWALAWHMTIGGDPDRMGVRLVIVGPREHVFHCYPATEVYPDWQAFLTHERETSA